MMFQRWPGVGAVPKNCGLRIPAMVAVPVDFKGECVAPVITGINVAVFVIVIWLELKLTFGPVTCVGRNSVTTPVLTVVVPAAVPPSVSVLPAAPASASEVELSVPPGKTVKWPVPPAAMTPCPTRTLPSAGNVPLATTVRLPPLRTSSEPVSPTARAQHHTARLLRDD